MDQEVAGEPMMILNCLFSARVSRQRSLQTVFRRFASMRVLLLADRVPVTRTVLVTAVTSNSQQHSVCWQSATTPSVVSGLSCVLMITPAAHAQS